MDSIAGKVGLVGCRGYGAAGGPDGMAMGKVF